MRKTFIVLGAAISVSACFAVTDDLSGLHDAQSLVMSFDAMYQHANQHFEFKLVDGANRTATRGIVLNLKMTDGRFKISLPLTIPSDLTGYRVDFWADETGDGKYEFDHAWEKDGEFARLDHSWRVFLDAAAQPPDPFSKVTHVDQSYLLAFEHNLAFVDLNELPDRGKQDPPSDTNINAAIHIDGLGAEGKMAQIRVADPVGHIVGLYRFRTSSLMDFIIPGCIEPGNVYTVDLYVDANGNNDANGNGYDDPSKGPGNDLGWRLPPTKAGDGTAGLSVTFNAADTAHGNVDVGPP